MGDLAQIFSFSFDAGALVKSEDHILSGDGSLGR